MLGRPREDEARDRGTVPPFGQHHGVADDLDGAGGKPSEDAIALLDRRGAVDVLG
jgi:hypothetical protein